MSFLGKIFGGLSNFFEESPAIKQLEIFDDEVKSYALKGNNFSKNISFFLNKHKNFLELNEYNPDSISRNLCKKISKEIIKNLNEINKIILFLKEKSKDEKSFLKKLKIFMGFSNDDRIDYKISKKNFNFRIENIKEKFLNYNEKLKKYKNLEKDSEIINISDTVLFSTNLKNLIDTLEKYNVFKNKNIKDIIMKKVSEISEKIYENLENIKKKAETIFENNLGEAEKKIKNDNKLSKDDRRINQINLLRKGVKSGSTSSTIINFFALKESWDDWVKSYNLKEIKSEDDAIYYFNLKNIKITKEEISDEILKNSISQIEQNIENNEWYLFIKKYNLFKKNEENLHGFNINNNFDIRKEINKVLNTLNENKKSIDKIKDEMKKINIDLKSFLNNKKNNTIFNEIKLDFSKNDYSVEDINSIIEKLNSISEKNKNTDIKNKENVINYLKSRETLVDKKIYILKNILKKISLSIDNFLENYDIKNNIESIFNNSIKSLLDKLKYTLNYNFEDNIIREKIKIDDNFYNKIKINKLYEEKNT